MTVPCVILGLVSSKPERATFAAWQPYRGLPFPSPSKCSTSRHDRASWLHRPPRSLGLRAKLLAKQGRSHGARFSIPSRRSGAGLDRNNGSKNCAQFQQKWHVQVQFHVTPCQALLYKSPRRTKMISLRPTMLQQFMHSQAPSSIVQNCFMWSLPHTRTAETWCNAVGWLVDSLVQTPARGEFPAKPSSRNMKQCPCCFPGPLSLCNILGPVHGSQASDSWASSASAHRPGVRSGRVRACQHYLPGREATQGGIAVLRQQKYRSTSQPKLLGSSPREPTSSRLPMRAV